MIAYDVKLVFDIDNRDYMIRNIKADSEDEAISIAKDFVADNGYFPGMSKKKIKAKLKVERIEATTFSNN